MTGVRVHGSSDAERAPPDGAAAARARSIPAWVWGIAVVAALVHMAPYWRAELQTPSGWSFTGNLSSSPDYMQYRVWMRQTALEGPLVTNAFTADTNRAYLPVAIYWIIGGASRAIGIAPEWGYAWLGAFVAMAFVVVLWSAIRRFVANAASAAWAFGIIMLGGGLGGYVMLLEDWPRARQSSIVQALVLRPFEPGGAASLFERFRGNYVVQTLFDTHFLIFWLVTLLAVMSLHATMRAFDVRRLLVTAGLFGLGTLLHIYEGITLLVITAFVLVLYVMRGLVDTRRAVLAFTACAAAVAVVLIPLAYLVSRSGIPAPTWRGVNILFLVVVIGYPVAFAMLLYGFGRFWREASDDRVFLTGWGLGGLAILLSGPLFPYSSRGAMTLSIPLAIVSVMIWHDSRRRFGPAAMAAVFLLVGSTPVWLARSMERRTTFKAEEVHKWVTPDHRDIVAFLGDSARRRDVLITDDVSLRWVAPDYPGVHYAGHFFLTPHHGARAAEVNRFLSGAPPAERRALLDRSGARWIFVPPARDAAQIAALPGVSVATRNSAGTLLKVQRSEER